MGFLIGGDYNSTGLFNCGLKSAHGLAKCGFGDLLHALSCSDLLFLDTWRDNLKWELHTNSRGYLPYKSLNLAKSIPNSFPSINILLSYTSPIISETDALGGNACQITWSIELNMGKLTGVCKQYFEWGYRKWIIKCFWMWMWLAMVCQILWCATLATDAKEAVGTWQSVPVKNSTGPLPIETPS
jgi:holliday junction resolvase YEN1